MKRIFIIVCLFISLCACSGKTQSDGPEKPVESFYQAIIEQNRDAISGLSCADWEKEALREVDAFMGVKAELSDLKCTASDTTETESTVTCTGSIKASYGAEVTDFPLANRSHKVIKEQGEWRICGY